MPDEAVLPRVLFVDITPTHGVANQDLAATLHDLANRGSPALLLPLKAALFRELINDGMVQPVAVEDEEWQNMWVRNEGINRRLDIWLLDGLYRRFRFSSYAKRVAEMIVDLLIDLSPDLVHCNSFDLRLEPVVAACRRRGVPVVCHVRTFREMSAQERRLAGAITHALASYEGLRAHYLQQSRLPAERCSVWHNGLPFERLRGAVDREALRREYGLSPGQRVVSVVGRIAPFRGHETFVQALLPLLAERSDAAGLVVGRVGYRERDFAAGLQRMADREVGPGRVVFVLDRKDEEAFVAASDILVHPNVNLDPAEGIVEPISRDLLLAMGLGVAVVATPSGSASVLVEDGRTGLVVPPRDPGALTAALRRLLDDPALAAGLARQAQERVLAEHRTSRRTTQLFEIYRTSVLPGA